MKRHYGYKQITSLIFLIIFLVGCASTHSNVGDKKVGRVVEQKEDLNKSEAIKISEFILGVGDSIEITVFRHDELKRTAKIDASGKIMFPLIGDVVVTNRGIFELRDELKERLSKYIVNPQIVINVTSILSQKIIVLGEVNSPGYFSLDSTLKVSDAISKAGGFTQYAKISNTILIRRGQGKADILIIDLEKILKGVDLNRDGIMQNGDIVYVPPKTIVSVARFMQNVASILSPILGTEMSILLGYQIRDAITATTAVSTGVSIPVQK